jgi:polyphenol oxidase
VDAAPAFDRVDLGPGVVAGFTRRAGGVSTGPWEGLDLGLHVGDDPEAVAANRRRLGALVGAPVVFGRQVHGVRTAVLPRDAAAGHDPFTADLFTADLFTADLGDQHLGEQDGGEQDGGYDALVSVAPGLPVGVLVADCVPVLLADAGAGVVAVAHAGRPGLLAGVLAGVLAAMIEVGARPDRLRAALGPAAGGCCYEVPERMQDDACAVLPQLRACTTWGTPALDLRAGCRAVLEAAGVGAVTTVGGCTIEDPARYSYRRARVTGRFAGAAMMTP